LQNKFPTLSATCTSVAAGTSINIANTGVLSESNSAFPAAQHLQKESASMSCSNISSPEFTSPFQIAAHLEFPGLPRITPPALVAQQALQSQLTTKGEKHQSANANIANVTGQSASGHFMKKLNDFDVWLAALSL
jgi:hypothetical protein